MRSNFSRASAALAHVVHDEMYCAQPHHHDPQCGQWDAGCRQGAQLRDKDPQGANTGIAAGPLRIAAAFYYVLVIPIRLPNGNVCVQLLR